MYNTKVPVYQCATVECNRSGEQASEMPCFRVGMVVALSLVRKEKEIDHATQGIPRTAKTETRNH